MRSHFTVVVAAGFIAMIGSPAQAQGQDSRQVQTTSVNDIRMAYRIQGQGPPLLLLHYFAGCGQIWEPHLERLGREFRLIIPDLRGHGGSTNPSGKFTHRQSARDVFALLDRLGIQRFKAVGTSSGGMTLLHMATQQPNRIEAPSGRPPFGPQPSVQLSSAKVCIRISVDRAYALTASAYQSGYRLSFRTEKRSGPPPGPEPTPLYFSFCCCFDSGLLNAFGFPRTCVGPEHTRSRCPPLVILLEL